MTSSASKHRFDQSRNNERQYAKVLMFELAVSSADWNQEGSDYWQWAKPVYRKPQKSWDSTNGFTLQKIWYTDKLSSDEREPDDIDFPKWIQCYWDSQAGRWLVFTPPASSGSSILVELEGDGYGYGESDKCDEKVELDTAGGLQAKVVLRPCGSTSVFGEVDDHVTVFDDVGWLAGFSSGDVGGKRAFAHLMHDEYFGCKWVLDIPNMFRERQVLRDWYVSGKTIIEELENHWVWNHCELENEITEGTDCIEGGSGSGGYGS